MTQQALQDFLKLLKKFHRLQPFTIEELTRLYLTEHGHEWDSLHEIAAHEDIENFLKEQELIQENGTTTVYTITKKVEEQ